MRRLFVVAVLATTAAVFVAGCGKVEDKVVARVTDNEGSIPPRTITVGYVNERLDRMPPHLMPDVGGEEGKLAFLDEIIRKELLVMAGLRLGLDKDPKLEDATRYFTDDKAKQMLWDDLIYRPAEPTQADLERFNRVRDTSFQLQEIVVETEDEAREVVRRVTEGGEDFGRVAQEVSVAASAADGGRRQPMKWLDLHPLTRNAITDLKKDEVTDPIPIGVHWYVYKILSRKDLPEPPPLEGERLAGIKVECRNFQRSIQEQKVMDEWKAAAKIKYNDEALEIASQRLGEELDANIPEDVESLSVQERMELVRLQIIPKFTEDEEALELVSFEVAGKRQTWTLGDLKRKLEELPGIEGIKSREKYAIQQFVWRQIRNQIVEHEVEKRGYANTREMADYLEKRREEFIVDLTYTREVLNKVEEPTGEEIKQYYRDHKDDYKRPPKVDVQQIIVGTEAEANRIYQQLTEGGADFTDLVRKHTIDSWSKSTDGVINNYYQGEKRLAYLQDVVFDLDVGEISRPFRAPGGYAVVKLLAKYPEEQLPFKEVSDVVKKDVNTLRREERLNKFLDEVRATVTIDTLRQNLRYVNDPAEVLKDKEAQRVVIRSSSG